METSKNWVSEPVLPDRCNSGDLEGISVPDLLNEVEKVELEARCRSLERDLAVLRSKCLESEVRIKKAEEDFRILLVEQEQRHKLALEEFGKYKTKHGKLEELLACKEEEYQVLCGREQRAQEKIVSLSEEIKKKEQELRDSECAKRRVESEMKDWKRKCGELELRISQLVVENLSLRGRVGVICRKDEEDKGSKKVSKLRNENDECCKSKLLPRVEVGSDRKLDSADQGREKPTPGGANEVSESTRHNTGETERNKEAAGEEGSSSEEKFLPVLTPKRKRTSRVITSDSEGEDDDGIPIAKLKMKRHGKVIEGIRKSTCSPVKCSPANSSSGDDLQDSRTPSRRRLFPLRQCKQTKGVGGEDELDAIIPGSTKHNLGETVDAIKGPSSNMSLKILHLDEKNEWAAGEDGSNSEKDFLPTPIPKRRHSLRVIASDSEGEDDDNRIRSGELKMNSLGEVIREPVGSQVNWPPNISFGGEDLQEFRTPCRRRLLPLRECREAKGWEDGTSSRGLTAQRLLANAAENACSRNKGSTYRKLEYPTPQNVEEDEVLGDKEVIYLSSNSEGESLGGFIVNDSDSSESKCSSNDASEEVVSDSSFHQVLATIRREKDTRKWEYEADMLASFSKEPELCMKAVCALYRQQTAEEKSVKGTFVANGRGFSTFDATKGSEMAEFLMDGYPHGPLKKSVHELEKYHPEGLNYCHKLAMHYSKQLFMIYQNKEDPFFLPS